MFAHPSRSSQTYNRYRDAGSGDDAGDTGASDDAGNNDRGGSGAGSRPVERRQAPGRNHQLLQEVLGETLIRNQEDTDQLIQTLLDLKNCRNQHTTDEELFVLITREVLKHRLGDRSRKLPADLHKEVGRALWTNDKSRQRIERLWVSLGAEN